MTKANLVLPMAGYGTRFKKAGNDEYKPLTKIKNKIIVE